MKVTKYLLVGALMIGFSAPVMAQENQSQIEAITKITLGFIIIALLLFVPANTLNYWNGWLLMGILFIPMFIFGIILIFKDKELLDIIDDVKIYARVSPSDKIRIVSLLQEKGHIVGFLGDGVNDSPALKKADVGVAMGINGTDVSKEASDIILMDDNYETIVKAIVRGRKVFQNIQNSILFLIAGNIAGIFMVLLTSFLNIPIPFASVHFRQAPADPAPAPPVIT